MMLANLGGLYSAGKSELQSLISSLFGQGQQGLLFVPQPVVLNEQRLYKLDDFTDPVTADGDPVGGGQEVSGNGNHLTQPTSADRPTYNTDGTLFWLGFDGVGDHLLFPSMFVGAQDIFISIALDSSSIKAADTVIEIGDGSGTGTRISIRESTGFYRIEIGGDAYVSSFPVGTGKEVLTLMFSGSQLSDCKIRVNGVEEAATGTTAINIADGPGRIAGSLLADREAEISCYGCVVARINPSAQQVADVEKYLANLAGITL